jgi:hypothetical protein
MGELEIRGIGNEGLGKRAGQNKANAQSNRLSQLGRGRVFQGPATF